MESKLSSEFFLTLASIFENRSDPKGIFEIHRIDFIEAPSRSMFLSKLEDESAHLDIRTWAQDFPEISGGRSDAESGVRLEVSESKIKHSLIRSCGVDFEVQQETKVSNDSFLGGFDSDTFVFFQDVISEKSPEYTPDVEFYDLNIIDTFTLAPSNRIESSAVFDSDEPASDCFDFTLEL